MKRRRAQSVLDFMIAFVAVAGLAIGIVRIWTWFNANYARRQVAYQKSRFLAGQYSNTSSYDEPIDTGATEDCPECTYEPLDLTEEWVFNGTPSGTVSGAEEEGEEYFNPSRECVNQCYGQDDCGDTIEDFNYDCACYVKCMCRANTLGMRQAMQAQGQSLITGALQLFDSAEAMRDRADDCDDPWEFCWWGITIGNIFSGSWSNRVPGELRIGSMHLQRWHDGWWGYNRYVETGSWGHFYDYDNWNGFGGAAERLLNNSYYLSSAASAVSRCCDRETTNAQEMCMHGEATRRECRQDCMEAAQTRGDNCRNICDAAAYSGSAAMQDSWEQCNDGCDDENDDCYDDCWDDLQVCYQWCNDNVAAGDPREACKVDCRVVWRDCQGDCDDGLTDCKEGCDEASEIAINRKVMTWKSCVRRCDRREFCYYYGSGWGACVGTGYSPCYYDCLRDHGLY